MRKPTIVLGLVLLLAGSAAWAADTGRYWKAALPTPTGQSVDLFVTLVQQDETWTGKLDMPQSGIRGLALTDVSVEGMNIKFTIAGL